MTQKEYKEALAMRPALQEIEKILGNGVSPEKKMELFKFVQGLMGDTIRRVMHDLGMLGVRKT